MTSRTLSQTAGKILAVDTSTASGSLAVGDSGKVLATVQWTGKSMHSELATREVTRVLEKAGFTLDQISHFTVNIGPGSFTGLRVGINLVRTLAYSLDKPVAAFSSLEVLASPYNGQKVLVAIKALRDFYYVAAYQDGQTLVEPCSMDINQIRALGPFDQTLIEGQAGFTPQTNAGQLVQLARDASFFSWNSVKPLYVRGSEAEEKLKLGILKPLA